ncbi:MAG TPA: gamma-butyrobetaine hydroxylase-like domain-containing protein [Oxalicibacterium sp.]|jgi:DUF971 family protein|nr:gamma-butyrobetaine hydroxylase-like domain-containing protein [Oxalicibacterium sp.]
MSCDDIAIAPEIPASAWPSEVRLNTASRTLELVWDGQLVALPHRVLRRSCRCSMCESTRRLIKQVLPVDDDIAVLKIEPLGSSALRLYFSDGHDRGIYPWTYIKQIAFGPTISGFTEALTKGWRDE